MQVIRSALEIQGLSETRIHPTHAASYGKISATGHPVPEDPGDPDSPLQLRLRVGDARSSRPPMSGNGYLKG
jgi:hypothetical protein